MTTESNNPQLDSQQHRAVKRAWPTPRVIESELANTQAPNPTVPDPFNDSIVYFQRFGPIS